jgi:hypothetical protein
MLAGKESKMAILSEVDAGQRLFGVATSYSYLGYSVIPVYGNSQPVRDKVAAVDWKPFQRRRATVIDFEQSDRQIAFRRPESRLLIAPNLRWLDSSLPLDRS